MAADVSTVCQDSLKQFLKAYDDAYADYLVKEAAWYAKKPSGKFSDYPKYEITKSAIIGLAAGQDYMEDRAAAECRRKGYGYAVDRAGPMNLTTGNRIFYCQKTLDSITTAIAIWSAQRPVFTAPLLESFICIDCSQRALNTIESTPAAKSNFKDFVQTNVLECITNLGGAATEPLPDVPTMPKVEPLGLPPLSDIQPVVHPSNVLGATWSLISLLCILVAFFLI